MSKVIPVKGLFVSGLIGLVLILALVAAQVRESPLGSAHQATSTPLAIILPVSSIAPIATSSSPILKPATTTPSTPTKQPTTTPSTSTQLPTPPAPAPASAQPSAAVGISIGDDFIHLSDAQLNTELDDMTSLGVRYVRFDLDWSIVERHEGKFDWSTPDRIIAALNAHGLVALPILDNTPTWARLGACASTNRCEPVDPEDYAAFAHAAAERYGSQGVHDWEIWNEPNDTIFWQPAPDPAVYAQMLIEAYNAIKDAEPSATVISGGLAAVASSNDDISPLTFLSDIYAAGAGGHFDAVGFHPYSFPALPSNPASWNAWQQISNTSPSLYSIMAANGDGNKKIWLTEYGAPTGGPEGVSEALQAQMIADAVAQVKTMSLVGPLFIYSYQDDGTDQSTSENFYGLLRFDGSQKPSYQALKDALAN